MYAGTNKLEVLMFSLGVDSRTGRRETFGINVFKVREVMRAPVITAAPAMAKAVKGMASLRGMLIPIMDLAQYIGLNQSAPGEIMITTEYSGRVQGFLVEKVDTILRLDWGQMHVPPEMIASELGGFVNAVTELKDGRLVMMLDVERILAETSPVDETVRVSKDIPHIDVGDATLFFADDSLVARGQIGRTLDAMGIKHRSAVNGQAAWEDLQKIAADAQARGKKLRDVISLVLTDVEMPEMDGYMLTKHIKSDSRFAGIPVIMHTSLSADSNQQVGLSVGVDEYVPKSDPDKLVETLARRLAGAHPG